MTNVSEHTASGSERLRDAARGMREKTEAATPGPWGTWAGPRRSYVEARDQGSDFTVLVETCPRGTDADIAYIAAMSPPVALAVAEWLDDEATRVDECTAGRKAMLDKLPTLAAEGWTASPAEPNPAALAVADAFLGVEHG